MLFKERYNCRNLISQPILNSVTYLCVLSVIALCLILMLSFLQFTRAREKVSFHLLEFAYSITYLAVTFHKIVMTNLGPGGKP